MSYGSCPVAEVVGDQPASRRAPLWQSVVLVSGLALVLTTCCVAVSGGLTGWGAGVGAVLLQGPERSQQRIQQLEEIQTSVRADLVHPYGSMFPANPKFINPSGQPSQAVNPSPRYPYHNGQRMKSVLNDDFEHAPFGNHLPWEHMPEGALAKYDKRPDKMKAYNYMVNRDGVVVRWDTPLKVSDVDPNYIGKETLKHLSPMPEPKPSTREVAQALVNVQRDSIQRSFRSILPTGAFHDSIMDSESGMQLSVPGTRYGVHHVSCPEGLVRCQDSTCVASMSYCPGCDINPMPEYCSANAVTPSGWRPSMIGCENETDVGKCGMKNGQGLFIPGEAVTGGLMVGGLA